MQKKDFNFTLPRTITRDQWRAIHSNARRMIYNANQKKGADYTAVFTRMADKYGCQFYMTIYRCARSSYFWDILSHYKHDRGFIKAALSGNSKGRTADRNAGIAMSLKDPNHPSAEFIKLQGGAK